MSASNTSITFVRVRKRTEKNTRASTNFAPHKSRTGGERGKGTKPGEVIGQKKGEMRSGRG